MTQWPLVLLADLAYGSVFFGVVDMDGGGAVRFFTPLMAAALMLMLLSEVLLGAAFASVQMAAAFLAISQLLNGLYAMLLTAWAYRRLRRWSWIGLLYLAAAAFLCIVRAAWTLAWSRVAVQSGAPEHNYLLAMANRWHNAGSASVAGVAADVAAAFVLMWLVPLVAAMLAVRRRTASHQHTNNAARPPAA